MVVIWSAVNFLSSFVFKFFRCCFFSLLSAPVRPTANRELWIVYAFIYNSACSCEESYPFSIMFYNQWRTKRPSWRRDGVCLLFWFSCSIRLQFQLDNNIDHVSAGALGAYSLTKVNNHQLPLRNGRCQKPADMSTARHFNNSFQQYVTNRSNFHVRVQ